MLYKERIGMWYTIATYRISRLEAAGSIYFNYSK